MAIITHKDQILNIQDRQISIIKMPEWGDAVEVMIMSMSATARDQFESSIVSKDGVLDTTNIRAKLVAASIVAEDGSLIFSDTDIEKLGQMSGIAMDRIFSAAQKINGLGDDEIEELAKN